MLVVHAGQGADDDLGDRFLSCFVQAADDAALPRDPAFRASLRAYMEWAVHGVLSYSPRGSEVPPSMPLPHWSWSGLEGNHPQPKVAGGSVLRLTRREQTLQ
jgi:hemoglobin